MAAGEEHRSAASFFNGVQFPDDAPSIRYVRYRDAGGKCANYRES